MLIQLQSVLKRFASAHLDAVSQIDDHRLLRMRSLSFCDEYAQSEKDTLADFFQYTSTRALPEPELGMNSPGILLDRISILIIKSILSKDTDAPAKAAEGVAGILTIFEGIRVAKNFLLKKESGTSVHASSFPDLMLHLLGSNMRMWLSQDIIYSDRPLSTYGYDVEDLVDLWGFENKYRNECINELEALYIKRNRYGR